MIRAKTKNKALLMMEPTTIMNLSRIRLANAVEEIHRALEEQRAEIHAFRQSVRTQNEAVHTLHQSWRQYDDSVNRIHVSRLCRRAGRLARIMDI